MARGTRPGLSQGISQQLSQRLGLSQGVMTSLAVLQMTAVDLAEMIAREAETNPFLRPGLPPPGAVTLLAEGFDADSFVSAPEASWQVSLLQQIGQAKAPKDISRLAAMLVAELDENGLLDTPLEELAKRDGTDLDDLEQALALVQACEPAGVGARSRQECLRLQLEDLGLPRADAQATLAHLALFAKRDWAGLKRSLNLPQPEIERRAGLLRQIKPLPDLPHNSAPVQMLRPDLVLKRDSLGQLSAESAHGHLPRPTLDPQLLKQAKAEKFGKEAIARAQALIRAVEGRGRTLERIGTWLANRQAEVFTRGPVALRPASRRDCAADLELHPSTITRAVQGKALLADGKLWPLAQLFSAPAPSAARADGTAPAQIGESPLASARAISHRIAQLISEEPKTAPLSDSAIVERLKREGVDIARRTVAKYRDDLRIPARSKRRGR